MAKRSPQRVSLPDQSSSSTLPSGTLPSGTLPSGTLPSGTTHYFTRQPLSDEVRNHYVRWITAQVAGCTLELATGAGVFSSAGLDAGSQLLIETAHFAGDVFASNARLCDLGCGWGAVGCFAAALAPESKVCLCDINLRAATLARLNIERNQLRNATVWCGDGLSAVRPEIFDTVLCNPPVRAGNRVITKLFNDAEYCLKSGGALWVVLRTAQGAKSWQSRLAQQIGNCATVAINGGYRILKSVK